jgi:hypothetical protein
MQILFYRLSCIAPFLTLALLSSVARASPLQPSHILPEHIFVRRRDGRNWKVEELNKEFSGLHWNAAFSSCSSEQLDNIIFATRAAMWTTALPSNPGVSMAYYEAWRKYFGAYKLWIQRGISDLQLSATIQSTLLKRTCSGHRSDKMTVNVRSVAKYPKNGHHKAPEKLGKKIHFTWNFRNHGRSPIESCVTRKA